MLRHFILSTLLCVFIMTLGLTACSDKSGSEAQFVTTDGTRLMLGDEPYRFMGANLWYGAILGSEGQGGDRERLCRELDTLAALGVSNLRILVGSDGQRGEAYKVEPTLQVAPGVYNDTILAGLDFLLKEMGERRMKAVLYLNNAWEWSGGYGYYLEQAGCGRCPLPADGYKEYCDYVAQFASNEQAQQLFADYVRFIIGRTNRYTGRPYTDDPAIMAWQICNEPRAFSDEAKRPFAQWLAKTSALIRQLDSNHLISLGSEGLVGCAFDKELWEQVSADPNIDYLTAHVWPFNWGWASREKTSGNIEASCDSSAAYVAMHVEQAARLGKPLVIEEFGYPRDAFSHDIQSATTERDRYYDFMFGLFAQSPVICGINFWAWGGECHPLHEWWQAGDPYCGDPAQEPQGLYSVFGSDSATLRVIARYAPQS